MRPAAEDLPAFRLFIWHSQIAAPVGVSPPRQGPIIGDKGAAGGGLLLKSTTVSYLNLTWLIWRQELLSMSELLGG